MFDIGFWELAFIGLLALLVLGPSRLPEAARSAGLWVGKLRTFITNVKHDLDSQLQSDELAELRRLKEELVQAREAIQQTSEGMVKSFTEGVDAQVQEFSQETDYQDPDFISKAVSDSLPAKPRQSNLKQKPKRKSGKPAVVKKGSGKKRPATKKAPTRKKAGNKKTTGKKKVSKKKTSKNKKIVKTKSKKNGR